MLHAYISQSFKNTRELPNQFSRHLSYQHGGKHPANTKFSPAAQVHRVVSGSSFLLPLSFGSCLEQAAAPCVSGVGLRGAAAARAGAQAVTGALCRLQLLEWAGRAQQTSQMSSSTGSVGPAWSSCTGEEQLSNYSKKPQMSLGSSLLVEGGATGRGVICVPPKPFVSPPSPW